MADPISMLFVNLNQFGFFSFILPWLLIFAVVFGLLNYIVKLFDANRRLNGLIAIIIAFFGTAYGGPAMATFFGNLFGGASILIAGILVILLLVGMAGKDISYFKDKWYVAAFLVVIGIVLFAMSLGVGFGFGGISINSTSLAIIFFVVVIALALWFITKEDGGSTGSSTTPGGSSNGT